MGKTERILCTLLCWTIVPTTFANAEDDNFSRLIINPNQTDRLVQWGENNFLKLVLNSRCLADKTLLIRDLIKNTGPLVMLTCPRKWGKTTNLNMLKLFLQIQVDEKGKRFPLRDRINHQLFRFGKLPGGNRLRRAPLISNYSDVLDLWLGWYPVINVSFAVPDSLEIDEKSFKSFVKERIRDAFDEHKYLTKMMEYVQQTKIRDVNISKWDSINFQKIHSDSATDEEYKSSLKTLSQILQRYFAKGAILLVDEYVSLINKVITSGLTNKKKILKFYCSIVNAVIHENDALKKAIFFGTLRTAKELSDLDNHEFLRSNIFENFVTNKNDLDEICRYLNVSPDTKNNLRYWYNGYRAGENVSLEVYHPFGLAKYLQEKTFGNYWHQEEGFIEKILPSFLENNFAQKALCNILSGHPCNLTLCSLGPLGFSTLDLETIWNSVKDSRNFSNGNLILKFFLNSGYLSPCNDEYTGIANSASNITTFALCIPNQETRSKLEDYLLAFYTRLFHVPDTTTLLTNAEQLAGELSSFILSNETGSLEIGKSVEKFLFGIEIADSEKMNEKNTIRIYKDLTRSLVNMLVVFSSKRFNFSSLEFGYHVDHPDALLVRQSQAAVIDFKFGSGNEESTNRAGVIEGESDIVGIVKSKLENVKQIKFVEIRAFSNKSIVISGKTKQVC